MSSTQLLKLSSPPRHGSVPEPRVREPRTSAERVRGPVVDARVGDQQIAPAVGGDQSDQLAKGGRRNAPALPPGQDAPSRFVGGDAAVIGLPPADAAGRSAVDVDAEHVRFASLRSAGGSVRAARVAPPATRGRPGSPSSRGVLLSSSSGRSSVPQRRRVTCVSSACAHGSPLSIGAPTPATPAKRDRQLLRSVPSLSGGHNLPGPRRPTALCTSSNGLCVDLWESYRLRDSSSHRKVTQWPTPPSVPRSPPRASARPPAVRRPLRTPRPRHPNRASMSDKVTDMLLGTWADTRREAREMIKDPAFWRIDGLSMDEHRERVLSQLHLLVEQGGVHRAFPKEYGGAEDNGGNIAGFEELVAADPSLQIKSGVQWGLFGSAVLHLGTKEHHDKWLPGIMSLEIPGAFAMTETGHGSDVAAIGTTATYDPETEEFVIHTPFRGGVEGLPRQRRRCTASPPIVFAQLITNGVNHGVHCFYVPIRDENGAFLPGHRRRGRRPQGRPQRHRQRPPALRPRARPAHEPAQPVRRRRRGRHLLEPHREPRPPLLHDARHARAGPRLARRRRGVGVGARRSRSRSPTATSAASSTPAPAPTRRCCSTTAAPAPPAPAARDDVRVDLRARRVPREVRRRLQRQGRHRRRPRRPRDARRGAQAALDLARARHPAGGARGLRRRRASSPRTASSGSAPTSTSTPPSRATTTCCCSSSPSACSPTTRKQFKGADAGALAALRRSARPPASAFHGAGPAPARRRRSPTSARPPARSSAGCAPISSASCSPDRVETMVAEIAARLRPASELSPDRGGRAVQREPERAHRGGSRARRAAAVGGVHGCRRTRSSDAGTKQVLTWLRDLFGLGLIEKHLAWYLINGRLSAQRARGRRRRTSTGSARGCARTRRTSSTRSATRRSTCARRSPRAPSRSARTRRARTTAALARVGRGADLREGREQEVERHPLVSYAGTPPARSGPHRCDEVEQFAQRRAEHPDAQERQ